jgi:hypothetical protein
MAEKENINLTIFGEARARHPLSWRPSWHRNARSHFGMLRHPDPIADARLVGLQDNGLAFDVD